MLTSLHSLQQENAKKSEKLMKIVNIEKESLKIFWTNSMKISEFQWKFQWKMWLIIILQITNKGFSISLKIIHLKKLHVGPSWPPTLLGLRETLRNQGDTPDFCKFWQTSGRSLISSMPIKRYILKLLYLATGFKMSLRDK